MKTKLAQDAKVLEYWRKRYLFQALVVAVVAVSASLAVWHYADFFVSKILAGLLSFMLFYIMYKSLRNSLQTRGEGLVLAKGEELFGEVMFDVGRGLCENALLVQEVCPPYQVRECDNVMRGKGYWLEEDWFYSVISSKFVPLNQTAFEGVILAFADTLSEDKQKGEILLKGGKAVVIGGLAPRLKQTKATETVVAFMQMFGADKAELAVADKTLYIWLATQRKLFFQFSLFRPNTLAQFLSRIERLKLLAEKMLAVLNG